MMWHNFDVPSSLQMNYTYIRRHVFWMSEKKKVETEKLSRIQQAKTKLDILCLHPSPATNLHRILIR